MTDQVPEISPALKGGASKRNLDAARKALAVLAFHGWEPLAPYPGSDTLWKVRCRVCPDRWEGLKYYSHIRGRTDSEGNWRPFSKVRHAGCLPWDDAQERLAKMRADRGEA